jgi:hypothetical protein
VCRGFDLKVKTLPLQRSTERKRLYSIKRKTYVYLHFIITLLKLLGVSLMGFLQFEKCHFEKKKIKRNM